jgi:hypothetical protein
MQKRELVETRVDDETRKDENKNAQEAVTILKAKRNRECTLNRNAWVLRQISMASQMF